MKYVLISLLLLPCVAQEASAQVATSTRVPAPQTPLAPLPETKPEDRGAIAGQVTSAATGEPVTKAVMVLRRTEAAQGVGFTTYTVTTDSKGMFALVDLEPGRYRLSATRTGYLAGEYGSRGPMRPGATLSIDKGQKLSDVKLRLTPHGVITGRVVDEDRDPMANVQILPLRIHYVQGRRQLAPMGGTNTNDLGEFRMSGVGPGRIYLLATARGPVAPEQPVPISQGPQEMYPPTFYPSGKEIAEAIPLDVTPGSQLSGIDFRLSKVRALRIKGRIHNAAGTGPMPISIVLSPREMLGMASANRAMSDPRGNFEIRGVTPGVYTLTATAYAEGGRNLWGSQSVEIGDSDLENVNLTIGAPMEITGQLRVEGEAPVSLAGIQVALALRGPSGSTTVALANEQGGFSLKNIGSAFYDVNVARLPDGFYVKSIRVGQQTEDFKTTGLDFSRGPSGPLEVLLNTKAGQVSGTAIDEKSRPTAAVTIVLMPQATEKRELMGAYKTAATDQNGRFALKNLEPGEYKIFAWEDIEPGAHMDPDFVKPVESRGQPVTIRESSREDLQVKIIPAE